MTNIHFKIIGSNDKEHTVNARFWTDVFSPEMLGPQRDEAGNILRNPMGEPLSTRADRNVSLPLSIPIDPQNQAFKDFVMSCAPRDWLEVLEAAAAGMLEPVSPLLGATSSFQEQVKAEVQLRMDLWARTRQYDDIKSACDYAGDEDPVFDAEGRRAKQVRSRTWRKCYQIMDEVIAGDRPVPTLPELLAELPEMRWPDEDPVEA